MMQRQLYRSLTQASQHFKAGLQLTSLKELACLSSGTQDILSPLLHRSSSSTSHLGPIALTLPFSARSYAGQARPSGVPQGAYQAPIAAARPANIRVTLVSSNLLAEPYKGELPALPLSAWVTITGWKERWRRWMMGVKSIYTIAKIRRNVKGWKLPEFKEEALKVYEEACTALADGDKTALRQLVTPSVFTDMKRQIKAREDGGWKKVEWELVEKPTLKQIEVVQGRLIAIDPKNDNTGFAQLTVRFKCGQKFAAYDARNRLVVGSKEDIVKVDDFWVFERPLKQQTANRWRVAGRLKVPQEGFLLRD